MEIDPAEIYHVLTYGSAEDNILTVPNIPRYAGEIRFYPTGMVTLIDYGTEKGTFVRNNSNGNDSGYVSGTKPLYDFSAVIFDDHSFAVADLRRILLKHNGTDALFTGTEVRQYEAYLREQPKTTYPSNAHEQRIALSTYDAYGF